VSRVIFVVSFKSFDRLALDVSHIRAIKRFNKRSKFRRSNCFTEVLVGWLRFVGWLLRFPTLC